MRLQVTGRNLDVTDALREHAERRLGRIAVLVPDTTRVELELAVGHNPAVADGHVAEATAWTRGPVLRRRVGSSDLYASIDAVADRLERQVKRYRDRRLRGRHQPARGHAPLFAGAARSDGEGDEDDLDDGRIVKSKRFALKPMSAEEAALQVELVGHDFFVFEDAESGEVNVVYRRRDGRYGLIAPER